MGKLARNILSAQSARPSFLGFSDRQPFHPLPLPLPKPPKTLSGPVSSSPAAATKSIAAAAAASSPASAEMLLPLRRLSRAGAVAASASADVLLPLRRLPGHLRRSLSTAASPPPWAMIYRLSETPNYTRGASFSLAPPPSPTLFSIPERAYDLEERKRNPDRRYVDVHSSVVFAASADGLLLLKTSRIRWSALTAAGLNLARPTEQEAKVAMEKAVEQEYVRYVCNPVTGQLLRLPDYLGMKRILQTATGLLTQAGGGGHGPPKRYAVVELIELNDEGRFVMFCFSSDTGKWDATVQPSPLQPGREMYLNHEVLALGGRLWWVDVSLGVLSMDPFSDKCELRHIKLPPGSVLPRQSDAEIYDLIRYRRVGVSDGRLLYVEVSKEAPYQIRSFVLDDESGRWTLEHQVSLDAKERPLVGAIDPLNTDLLYLKSSTWALKLLLAWTCAATGSSVSHLSWAVVSAMLLLVKCVLAMCASIISWIKPDSRQEGCPKTANFS